jgi:probable rRNA maturation factor
VPVELTCRAVSARLYACALRVDALTLLRILALEHCELSLMIVGDGEIRRLNREFRGKDRATDVLSFPQLEPARELQRSRKGSTADAPPLVLGDIVISIDTARWQARELGHRVPARIRTLLIHGMLHLLGYDHERSLAEARRMFALEHELAALMQGKCIDNAREGGSRSRLVKAPGTAMASPAKRADATGDLQWSPAAMLKRSAKAVKKTSARP